MPSGHAKAAVDGTVIADAASYEVVENNIYFPPSAIKTEYFSKTDHTTHCPWKGDASYYTIKIGAPSSGNTVECHDGLPFMSEIPSANDTVGSQVHTIIHKFVRLATDYACQTDKNLENAAWYYPDTFEKANHIKGYVAFYKNKVNITTE